MQALNYLSEQAGLSKKRVLQGLFMIILIFIIFGVAQSFLANLIGVAYPLSMSIYALET